MISHILNECGIKSKVVGNIGVGILWEILENGLDYKYVLELSSFQLSSIEEFRSKSFDNHKYFRRSHRLAWNI